MIVDCSMLTPNSWVITSVSCTRTWFITFALLELALSQIAHADAEKSPGEGGTLQSFVVGVALCTFLLFIWLLFSIALFTAALHHSFLLVFTSFSYFIAKNSIYLKRLKRFGWCVCVCVCVCVCLSGRTFKQIASKQLPGATHRRTVKSTNT